MTTAFKKHTNNARTTLATAIDTDDLSIVLATGNGVLFPAAGAFWVTVYDDDPADGELVLIDSRSSDTLTVNASGRGAQGTTAAAWSDGANVALFMTAGALDEMQAAINAIEEGSKTLASVTASGNIAGVNISASGNLTNTLLFSFGPSEGGAVTISSGSITPTRTNQRVDTEGAASSDELDTVVATGLPSGTTIFLRTVSSSRDVTIKHGTGNISCFGAADIVLNITSRRAMLMLDAELGLWLAFQIY